jgi:hypothetical protein
MDVIRRLSAREAWFRPPFPAMLALVLALYVIREEFPFSNFPMYSNISEEADVTFVTDQNDQPLPMKQLFKTSSGTSKKMYKKELGTITNAQGRDSEQATAEERARAGKAVLEMLVPRLVAKAVPPGTTALRFHVRTFRAGVGPEEGPAPEKLAEHPLTATES